MTQEEIREKAKVTKRYLDSCEEGKPIPSLWIVPEGYELIKRTVKGVPVERLVPDNWNGKTILNMHGGGFVLALGDVYRDSAVMYSQIAGNAQVINFDYRVAPTYKAPVALDDAVAVYSWLLEQGTKPEDIMFLGDSAGGNLVLATGLYLRDHNIALPAGIFAISPWGSMDGSLASRKDNWKNDVVLGEGGINAHDEVYKITYHKDSDIKDPYVSPSYGDYTGMPSLLIQAGSYEVLLDDAILVAEAAKKAEIDVTFTMYNEMSHVFQIAIPELEESKQAWAEAQAFMQKIFSK